MSPGSKSGYSTRCHQQQGIGYRGIMLVIVWMNCVLLCRLSQRFSWWMARRIVFGVFPVTIWLFRHLYCRSISTYRRSLRRHKLWCFCVLLLWGKRFCCGICTGLRLTNGIGRFVSGGRRRGVVGFYDRGRPARLVLRLHVHVFCVLNNKNFLKMWFCSENLTFLVNYLSKQWNINTIILKNDSVLNSSQIWPKKIFAIVLIHQLLTKKRVFPYFQQRLL